MSLSEITIAVDVDETIAASNSRLAELVRKDYNAEIYAEDITNWDYRNIDLDCDISPLVQNLYEDERYIPQMEPIPGSVETLNEWHESGAEIIIATHRTSGVEDVTKQWLNQQGVPYDDFYCSKELDKHELDADILIDDWHENIIRAANSGLQSFLVLGSHNYDRYGELLPDHENIHTPVDVMDNTPLSLISNTHLQWDAFDTLVRGFV